MNYDSPSAIENRLKDLGIGLKKRWGQNFLIDKNSREKLISRLEPEPMNSVWEIGPGLGSITVLLAPKVRMLTVFEIDWGLVNFLKKELSEYESLRIVQGDFIETWEDVWNVEGTPDRIIGNLPYSSASVIIASLLTRSCISPVMVFTVQKETAERMVASPRQRNYSSFSVLSQTFTEVTKSGDLKPGSFYPSPEVVSSVVLMKPKVTMPKIERNELYFRVVRSIFSSRRKTVVNNLLKSGIWKNAKRRQIEELCAECDIDLFARGEELTVDKIVYLSNTISSRIRDSI